MKYLVVAGFLLVGLCLGLVLAYKRLPRIWFVLLVTLLIGGPLAAFKLYDRRFALEVVPDALKVDSIAYRKEESWGFGPGGNEAGIRVYPLSEELAGTIEQRGLDFFLNLAPNEDQSSRDWRGLYEDWAETPVKSDQRWKADAQTGHLDVYDFICAYGFCIDIKAAVVDEANSIVNRRGSYYAYGRIGLIVVSPEKRLVIYLYNG